MVRNSRELIMVSFACLASVAVISIPVYFTGEPAKQAIERLAGTSEEVIERHEEAAQFAFTAIECVARWHSPACGCTGPSRRHAGSWRCCWWAPC